MAKLADDQDSAVKRRRGSSTDSVTTQQNQQSLSLGAGPNFQVECQHSLSPEDYLTHDRDVRSRECSTPRSPSLVQPDSPPFILSPLPRQRQRSPSPEISPPASPMPKKLCKPSKVVVKIPKRIRSGDDECQVRADRASQGLLQLLTPSYLNRSWCCRCTAWHTGLDLQGWKCIVCNHRVCEDCEAEVKNGEAWIRMRRGDLVDRW